ncbi:DNA primase large subunit [Nematocida displodere]|uniref:DNA primase large subunit n=1 Tax=Nematocida displodere TaxID=1805483 RepID=A0A177ED75_9MICR|nr:DNA primase large subunit [Nematocida displodere]
MKSTRGLRFYIGEAPDIGRITDFSTHVQNRRKVYEHIERHRELPFDALITQEWSPERDVNMHYAARISSVAEPGRIEEFVSGETKIFKIRLEQMPREAVVRFFIEEYLARLQEEIRYTKEEESLFIEIDNQYPNWVGAEKVNKNTSQQILALASKNMEGVKVKAHFTHHHTLRERVSRGYLCSGHQGMVSILVRAFAQLLRLGTNSLYLSGKVSPKYAVSESAQGLATVRIEEEYFPRCVLKTLDTLKKEKHLKYQDRTNLCKFFKNIGVAMEETISLFRRYFNCSDGQFEKEYKYRIRHIYGQEGSKIDYKSASCVSIIKETGLAGCTGCPYARTEDGTRKCAEELSMHTKQKEEPLLTPAEYYKRRKGFI